MKHFGMLMTPTDSRNKYRDLKGMQFGNKWMYKYQRNN